MEFGMYFSYFLKLIPIKKKKKGLPFDLSNPLYHLVKMGKRGYHFLEKWYFYLSGIKI